jgi:hypothetical protein
VGGRPGWQQQLLDPALERQVMAAGASQQPGRQLPEQRVDRSFGRAWAVGYAGQKTLFLHWNGTTWH